MSIHAAPSDPPPPRDERIDQPLLRHAERLKNRQRQQQAELPPDIAQDELDALWSGSMPIAGSTAWPGDLSDPTSWWPNHPGDNAEVDF